MKKCAVILSACVIIVSLVWGISIAKCEILTDKYNDDFEYAYQSNSMISTDVEHFKVLECDDESAKVYYYSEKSGNVLTFEKQNSKWVEKRLGSYMIANRKCIRSCVAVYPAVF